MLPKFVATLVPPAWPWQGTRKKAWKPYGEQSYRGTLHSARSHLNVARYWLSRQEHQETVIVFFSGVDKITSFPALCQGASFGFFSMENFPKDTEEVIFNNGQDYLTTQRACQGVLVLRVPAIFLPSVLRRIAK